jgi:hypothetical protein
MRMWNGMRGLRAGVALLALAGALGTCVDGKSGGIGAVGTAPADATATTTPVDLATAQANFARWVSGVVTRGDLYGLYDSGYLNGGSVLADAKAVDGIVPATVLLSGTLALGTATTTPSLGTGSRAYYRMDLAAAARVKLTTSSTGSNVSSYLADSTGAALTFGAAIGRVPVGSGSYSVLDLAAGTYYVWFWNQGAAATTTAALTDGAGFALTYNFPNMTDTVWIPVPGATDRYTLGMTTSRDNVTFTRTLNAVGIVRCAAGVCAILGNQRQHDARLDFNRAYTSTGGAPADTLTLSLADGGAYLTTLTVSVTGDARIWNNVSGAAEPGPVTLPCAPSCSLPATGTTGYSLTTAAGVANPQGTIKAASSWSNPYTGASGTETQTFTLPAAAPATAGTLTVSTGTTSGGATTETLAWSGWNSALTVAPYEYVALIDGTGLRTISSQVYLNSGSLTAVGAAGTTYPSVDAYRLEAGIAGENFFTLVKKRYWAVAPVTPYTF